MKLNLETMTNMSLLMKERSDRRTDEQLMEDTKAMLVRVLNHNDQPLDGEYTFVEWRMMKEEWQVARTLGFEAA